MLLGDASDEFEKFPKLYRVNNFTFTKSKFVFSYSRGTSLISSRDK